MRFYNLIKMKNLYFILLWVVFVFPNKGISQFNFIADQFFSVCKGDTFKMSFNIGVNWVSSIDSIHWRFDSNGRNLNIYLDTTIVGNSLYFAYTDTFVDVPPEYPFFDCDVYFTSTDSVHDVKNYILGSGGLAECEIRFAKFTASKRNICAGQCINFTDLSDRYPDAHQWYFEGADPPFSNDRHPKNICYDTPGKYEVKLVVENSINSDSITYPTYIEVLPQPTVETDTIVEISAFLGDTIPVFACATGEHYQWNPATGIACATCPNTSIVVTNQNTYYCTVWNDSICKETCTLKINIKNKESKVFIPNAFSPNADNANDYFEIFGSFVEFKYLKIFNRWGGLLYETLSAEPKWDGYYNGKVLPPGVFVYQIMYTDLNNNETMVKTGTITIVK
jgi:gliding motility-associated-like protein